MDIRRYDMIADYREIATDVDEELLIEQEMLEFEKKKGLAGTSKRILHCAEQRPTERWYLGATQNWGTSFRCRKLLIAQSSTKRMNMWELLCIPPNDEHLSTVKSLKMVIKVF